LRKRVQKKLRRLAEVEKMVTDQLISGGELKQPDGRAGKEKACE
jgi:hypothetical protein